MTLSGMPAPAPPKSCRRPSGRFAGGRDRAGADAVFRMIGPGGAAMLERHATARRGRDGRDQSRLNDIVGGGEAASEVMLMPARTVQARRS